MSLAYETTDLTKRRSLSAYDATWQSLGGISVQQQSRETDGEDGLLPILRAAAPARLRGQMATRKLAVPSLCRSALLRILHRRTSLCCQPDVGLVDNAVQTWRELRGVPTTRNLADASPMRTRH